MKMWRSKGREMRSLIIILSLLWASLAFAGSLDEVIKNLNEVKKVELSNNESILAAGNGLTLYTFDADGEGVSNCFGSCLVVWPPLLTDQEELPEPFSIHIREDGAKQVVLDGSPLYFFQSDSEEGQTFGDGIGGVWHIITL